MNEMAGMPLITLLLAVLLRWCVSLHGYSGEGQPPMFGDYEAQRHWMEITSNLPLREWYFNTTNNDLMYWGLDYPPLTAYHSFLCGYVANILNPQFVSLGASRGHESYEHKLFMRVTVLIADFLIYIPAVYWFFCKILPSHNANKNPRNGDASPVQTVEEDRQLPAKLTFLALIYPGLILIDHGHFQYNGISLGLMVAAVAALCKGRDLVASVLFCLSLNYKQMELYHALPFFCYLLGNCIPKENKSVISCFLKLISLGSVVVTTFLIIWFPFLKDVDIVAQVVHRLFPIARGVFEDKVSNVWCFLNVFYKFRNTFTNIEMAKICLFATTLAVLPSSIDLLFRPKLQKFLISLINSSLAFFLFSFQVHEKSILLAAIPVAMYFPYEPLPCFWFLFISTFSMLPLIMKDSLLLPYTALTLFYCFSIMSIVNHTNFFHGMLQIDSTDSSFKIKKLVKKMTGSQIQFSSLRRKVTVIAFAVSLSGCVVLSVCSVIIKPPTKYPDLFPLLVSVYSCLHFVAFFVYFNYRQIFTLPNLKLKTK